MKKILSIALVALLAASAVFAGISGNASLSLGYDTTSKIYGMSNGTGVTATIELATEDVEKVAEGDIYAGIKASMKLAVLKDNENKASIFVNDGFGKKQGLGLWVSVDEAYVAGAEWKLSILSGKGAPDYAKSAIDGAYKQNKDDFGGKIPGSYSWKATTYKVSAWNGAGATLSYKGYTVAAGFSGNATDNDAVKYFAFNVFAESKAFEFEGGSFQVAAIVARDGSTDDAGNYTALDKTNAGFSAKANYAKDELSASVAADFGLENFSDLKFKFDTALKVAYSPVTLDVYFKHAGDEDNLLSAKVSVSIENVSGSVYAKDILTEANRTIGGSVEATIDAFTVGGGASIVLESKKFSANASVKYAAEKFTAKAGVNFGKTFDKDDTTILYATASVESEVIIPGATLSLTYGADSKSNDMNFLKDQEVAQNFGAITAKCKIAF